MTAAHLEDALSVLLGEKQMEDLGRPVSPLVRRSAAVALEVAAPVRELVQRWFGALGGDPRAVLDGEVLSAFRSEVRALSR